MQLKNYSLFCLLGILCALATVLAAAQSQDRYYGKLDGHLHIDPEATTFALWDEGTSDDATRLGVPLQKNDHLFKGQLTLSDKAAIRFYGVIVQSADGTDVLYLDLNQDGRFEANERFVFQPVEDSAHDPWSKNRVELELPLASGPYRICPVQVRVVRADAPKPPPLGKLLLFYARQEFVEGYAQLPDRSLLMRFEYSFEKKAIDLDHHMEWVDGKGDGKIDTAAGSMDVLKAKGNFPIFRIGKLVLSVRSIDLATNSFVLRSVPSEQYQRFDLQIGATMPDFSFVDFSGKPRHLSQIKARYLLLDFWATWCHPCVEELSFQKNTYEQFHNLGFEILGINGDDSLEKPQKLLLEKQIAWPQARRDQKLIEDKFQIYEWPTMVLIDAHRRIISMGGAQQLPLDGENLGKTIEALLRKHP